MEVDTHDADMHKSKKDYRVVWGDRAIEVDWNELNWREPADVDGSP